MIVRRIEEPLELRIRDRRPIDIEAMHVHAMPMEPASRVFPRILHIGPRIVATLNLDTAHLELVVALGNAHHSFRNRRRLRSLWNFYQCLWYRFPFPRIAGERALRTFCHVVEQVPSTFVRLLFGGQNRAVTEGLKIEAQDGLTVRYR